MLTWWIFHGVGSLVPDVIITLETGRWSRVSEAGGAAGLVNQAAQSGRSIRPLNQADIVHAV